MHASRRQKKARARPFSPPVTSHLQASPAYKVAKLTRGQQGFGFTISGQAPCILSCVVPNSSADRAGLHAGDCLLAVNGCDVSRAPHDEVVRLVGSCMGMLRLHLAESGIPPATAKGYSSSDEESDTKLRVSSKARPPRTRHANRLKRKGATPPGRGDRVSRDVHSRMMPVHPMPTHSASGTKHRRRRNSSNSSPEHIGNLMSSPNLHVRMNKPNNGVATNSTGQLMYRSVVGYLGTIEMPEDSSSQSSPSSGVSGGGLSASGSHSNSNNSAAARLAAIRSCVRRLRVEKKVHTLVLLRVWGPRPGGLAAGAAGASNSSASTSSRSSSGKITLTSPAGANLARFPARRVVFCGAYADDARFFGLVTSASHDSDDDDDQSASEQEDKMLNARKNSAGFTSCHVFMVDSRLVAHEGHAARAHAFRFQCTPAAGGDGRCLEFPPTAEPILQAVLSLCASSGCHGNNAIGLMGWANPLLQQQQQHHQQQQQQQQQQHNLSSHSSSSSSNSDSGIFRDRDDGKNSDRDVQLQLRHQQDQLMMQHHNQPASLPLNGGNLDRLTVRAMPDPLMVVKSPGEVEHAARLRSSMQRYLNQQQQQQQQQPQPAMLLLNRNTGTHQHVNPSLSVRATMTLEEKLSPQVFKGRPGGLPHPANRPARTPSERSRARSLDDLSKSCQQARHHHQPSDPAQHHHHPQQLGSDNGLDKIDWETGPFDPVVGWHSLAGQSSASHQSQKLATRLDYEDEDDGSQEDNDEVSPPASSDQRCQDEGPGSRTATLAAAASEPILVGTLDKPIQAAAAAADHHHPQQQQQPPQQQQQQHVWTQGFEKLLEDPLGLRAFAGFLKKEFSHENIYFWAACERFHRLFPTEDTTTASYEAQKIFERHLGPAASEPVNVDSQARQKAEDNLCQPGPELFDQAQKQVFNLMKYDCYPRFLRSPIYRECVQALQHNEAPPISELTLNDPDLNIDYDFGDGDTDSLNRNLGVKKSESDAGERRRRSLLPWPKKDRSKSKDRGESDYRKTAKKKNRQGSTSSGPDKEKENATDDEDHHIKRAASRDSVASEFSDRAFHIQNTASTVPLVKVLLPDLSSAVIAARPGQSVQQLLSKLLERRGLRFNAFELYDSHSGTTIELERDASVLSGMEIRLEPRVVFHLLLLQSGKSLMIRGQPRRQLGEVVKPILLKYGLKIEHSIIVKSATGDVVPTKTLLASLDGCHLKVTNRDEVHEELEIDNGLTRGRGSPLSHDEPEDLPTTKNGSLLGRKGLNRRNSLQTERSRTISAKKPMAPTKSEGTIQNPNLSVGNKRLSLHDLPKSNPATAHLMPPPRVPLGSRKPNSQRNPLTRLENEALYERLKRAQQCRLEDQRGTEINFELPDFLKLPGMCSNDDYSESHELPLDGRASEPIGCRPRRVYQESYEFPLDGRASEPLFSRRDVVSEPRSSGSGMSGSCASPDFAAIAAQILDKSFSADGLMPTHEQAEKYFGSSSTTTPSGTMEMKTSQPPAAKITVAAAKQNVANVAARIAAIEQKDRAQQKARQVAKSNSNSNWDDLLLDLDVDWRCYQGRETDDQKQQLQQHSRPRNNVPSSQQQQPLSSRPPLPTPPALELLDLDDPLTAASPAPPPPLPPKPGKTKINEPFKAPTPQPLPPPRPPSRTINTSSRVNVSFV